jgi:branched-chain amino acid aminotransferase
MLCYVNGVFANQEEAKISVLDLGLMRGYGVFDYLRTYEKKPFHLREHLLRLKYSVEQLGLSLPEPLEKIEEIVLHLIQKSTCKEASIKILITGGLSPDQLLPDNQESLIILVYPHKGFALDYYTDGIKAVSTTILRSLPEAKTLQYTQAIIALKQGKTQKAAEALYVNAKREILEGTTCNFFAFKGNTLITSDSTEILFGITREIALKLAQDLFPIELRSLSYEEIPTIEEAFFTSTNKEIMPLVQIDDLMIGKGVVGDKTRMLMERFAEYTRQSSWPDLEISRYQYLRQ